MISKNKIRELLGRDPQKLAFKISLTNSYSVFARNHPAWVKQFFDGPFLEGTAAPILARCLMRDGEPNPVQLASAWADHLDLEGDPRDRQIQNMLLPAATTFLNALDEELRTRDEFQALFDSRALDHIADSSAKISASVDQLRHELTDALASAAKYQISIGSAQTAIIGDRNVVNQYFTEGIAGSPYGYEGRIRQFVDHYIDTPFAGRKAEFESLDAWLNGSDSSPYLLLTAPAGRGKSALMVHWSQLLAEEESLAVAFMPVSIRFRTNLASVVLAALVARLAYLYQDELHIEGSGPEEWRDQILSYLQRPLPDGRKLVVVLDGVDESADWQLGPDLLPIKPPETLRVVVTARETAESRTPHALFHQFGWDRPNAAHHMTLSRISVGDIANALQEIGLERRDFASGIDIAGELYRLSEGEPLLVRLHIDEIQDRIERGEYPIAPAWESISPGLRNYFERWWKKQQTLWDSTKSTSDATAPFILGLLSVAQGPLSLDDIQQLAPDSVLATSYSIRETIQTLRRFVVGDAGTGYVFGHPQLGEFFYDRLSKAEQTEFESGIVAWGMRAVDDLESDRLAPEDAPPYLVQFLGLHLEQRVDLQDIQRLVTGHWQRAWYAFDGTYAGFLGDVARAWRLTSEANAPPYSSGVIPSCLVAEVRCALAHASCVSLAEAIPDEILAALVDKRIWTIQQATSFAHQMTDRLDKALAFTALAPYMDDQMLERALEEAQNSDDDAFKVQVLEGLSPYLPDTLRDSAIANLHSCRSKAGRLRSAAAVIGLMPIESRQEFAKGALENIHLLGSEGYPEFLEAFSVFEDTIDSALPRLVECLDTPAAQAQLSRLREKAWFTELYSNAELVRLLAERMQEGDRNQTLFEALQIARSAHGLRRARLLGCLAQSLVGPLKDEVLEEALATWRENLKAGNAELWTAFDYIAPQLPEPKITEALDTVRNSSELDQPSRARGIQALAKRLPDQRKHEALTEALEIAHEFEDASTAYIRTSSIAFDLADSGYLDEALSAIADIPIEHVRKVSITYLAPLLDKERLRSLIADARRIMDHESQSRILSTIASEVDDDKIKIELFNLALMAAQRLWNPTTRNYAIAHVVGQIGEEEHLAVTAVELSKLINDQLVRVEVVSSIAARLPQDEKMAAIDWAVSVATPYGMASEILMRHANESEFLERLVSTVESDPNLFFGSGQLEQVAPELKEEQANRLFVIAAANEPGSIRASITRCLIPRLSSQQRDAVLAREISLAEAITDPSERSASLQLLGTAATDGTRDELLSSAIDATNHIEPPFQRLLVLERIAEEIGSQNGNPAIDKVYELTCTELSGPDRVHGLFVSSRYMIDMVEMTALPAEIATLEDPRVQAGYIEKLSTYCPFTIIPELYEVASSIRPAHERGRALIALLSRMPDHLIDDALDAALEALSSVDVDWDRHKLIESIMPHLLELPSARLHEVWSNLVHISARRTRWELLGDLTTMIPIFDRLGGEAAMIALAESVAISAGWWP